MRSGLDQSPRHGHRSQHKNRRHEPEARSKGDPEGERMSHARGNSHPGDELVQVERLPCSLPASCYFQPVDNLIGTRKIGRNDHRTFSSISSSVRGSTLTRSRFLTRCTPCALSAVSVAIFFLRNTSTVSVSTISPPRFFTRIESATEVASASAGERSRPNRDLVKRLRPPRVTDRRNSRALTRATRRRDGAKGGDSWDGFAFVSRNRRRGSRPGQGAARTAVQAEESSWIVPRFKFRGLGKRLIAPWVRLRE